MRLASFLAGIGLIVAGVTFLTLDLTNDARFEARPTAVAFPSPVLEAPNIVAFPEPSLDVPGEPEPTPEPSQAPVARLEIPSLGIQAPVVSLGILAGGVMEAPHTPTDVGWYRFSAQPGTTGNAVFAGHVDYARYGPAVFYRLRDLKAGDEIRVMLEDGSTYSYHVVSSQIYQANNAPVQEIIGPTENQTITLITCTGVFNRNVLEYDKRLVVRAERGNLGLVQ